MIQLYNDDCLKIMPTIPDKSIDLILCDLPYGSTNCAWDVIIPFDKLWSEYERIIKDNGAIVLTATQPFASALIISNIKLFRYEWIWNKKRPSNPLMANKQPLRNHEQVLVFYKKQPTYNTQPTKKNTVGMLSHKYEGTKRQTETYGEATWLFNDNSLEYGFPKTIIDDIPMESNLNTPPKFLGMHPTQKPVALMEYLIKTYTNEGDTVLDNCMGSGSTIVACIKQKRNGIGIELDKTYFDKAKERIDYALHHQSGSLI